MTTPAGVPVLGEKLKKVGEKLRRTSVVTALSVVLALALPAAAAAQFMDPVLEQYAPSSQQIDKKVKGDGGGGGGGGGGDDEGDVEAAQPGATGAAGGDPDGDTQNDGGSGAGGAGGGSGGGGGETGAGGGGDLGAAAGEDAGAQSGSEASGLDARLLSDLPVTWFDFLAFVVFAGALIGAALLLRRLSRSPRIEA
jgi:hypothetical protein